MTRTVKRVHKVDPLVAEAIRLTNVERARAGCGSVRMDTRLNAAARLHSEDMARHSYFSHTSRDGRSPWDRIGAQGYTAGSGENIAAGYTTAAAVIKGWMDSPGHKANMLNCSHKAVGIGIGRGGYYGIYWTQNFGRS
ncbi:MAG: CAP domain-containing protein [Dermatophilaceae bacterium]